MAEAFDFDDSADKVETYVPSIPSIPSGPSVVSTLNYDDVMDIEPPSALNQPSAEDVDEVSVREEALHLRGVDDLSTKDIKAYINRYVPGQDFDIEWIDDTSLNVVFQSHEIADMALKMLAPDSEGLKKTELRTSVPLEDKVQALSIRYALNTDRKVKGARARSRYYLFHGEPSPIDDVKRGFRPPPRSYQDAMSKAGSDPSSRRSKRQVRHRSPLRSNRLNSQDDDDLFPEKVRYKDPISLGSVSDYENDLFPATAKSDHERRLNRSEEPVTRKRDSRSKSPIQKEARGPTNTGEQLAMRLGGSIAVNSTLAQGSTVRGSSAWPKGDLFSTDLASRLDNKDSKRRSGRRKAHDMY